MGNSNNVVILATGGTIAGTAARSSQSVGYSAAQLGVDQLLAAVPDLAEVAGGGLIAEQVAQLDSKDMDDAAWRQLALRCRHWLARADVAAVVITHGTDTLEETAWFLQQVLPAGGKPVVLTCAMRPATALLADGPQNLRDAVACAVDAQAQGVLVVVAGQVHGARAVRKQHPYRLDAFSSAEQGAMGWIEEGQVRWQQPPQCRLPEASAWQADVEALPCDDWPWVEVVSSHAGCDGRAVDALLAQGVQGLVVAATGNGTLHRALGPALHRALQAGVPVWLSTRCSEGQLVAAQGHATQAERQPRPVDLPPFKARISLQLALLAHRA
ncbi:asparaginase [Pantoea sp. 18069]|uniref:asparaginase n=1 Tax=Pantoea sp. 18069 TaxID=2681415 RepID=UPI00190F1589|nr:asparaginase [Pantoea sp. 18069]